MPTHNESVHDSTSAPSSTRCIYCEKPLRPDEALRWGFDEIPVCVECYKTLDALKEDRIDGYRRYAGMQRRDHEASGSDGPET